MIYTAKKDGENWILVDDESEVLAKAKIQFKNKNAYGKIKLFDKEIGILYNSLSFKNNREHIKLTDGKQINDTVYRNKHFDKKHGFYYNYYLRWCGQSYLMQCVNQKNSRSIIYIYQNKQIICVMESISSRQYEIIDIFLGNDDYLDVAFIALTSLQIYKHNKKLGVSNYAPAPLNNSDTEFIYRVKTKFLRES